MYVLFQQTENFDVTIVVLRIPLFGAAIYSNLLNDQRATSGDPLIRKKYQDFCDTVIKNKNTRANMIMWSGLKYQG